jgi:hypothetical protein
MFVDHIILSGGQQIPIHHQAREILHALVCPRIDVQRLLTLVANSEVGDQCGFQNLSRRYLCSWNAIKSVALNAGWYGRGIRHQCHCWG